MLQTVSIKDTRNRLAELVEQVAVGGDTYVITKFGRPRVMLTPFVDTDRGNLSGIEASFGAWRGRRGIKDSGKWVRKLRIKMSLRQK